ncbi:hypothetical protein NPIL_567651, partial [Nephila pilipes]
DEESQQPEETVLPPEPDPPGEIPREPLEPGYPLVPIPGRRVSSTVVQHSKLHG